MTYRLPSLNGLRAFEAAARHLSFKHAANELCVTAGAVSQQVKALEEALGIALFKRLPRGLALTAEGETYLDSVSAAFEVISGATDKVSETLRGRKLRLGVAPELGADVHDRIGELQDRERQGFVAVVSAAGDLDRLPGGSLDALLRPRIKSHPGLHLDQLDYADADGETQEATLAVMPGLAGCREHRLLLQALSRIL